MRFNSSIILDHCIHLHFALCRLWRASKLHLCPSRWNVVDLINHVVQRLTGAIASIGLVGLARGRAFFFFLHVY